jgi:DnaJ family protein B protein 4
MTYYELFGVSKDASEDQIKKAYKKLAFQFHPDRNSDPRASAKFQELNEANEVLSDSTKRQMYDAQLSGVHTNTMQFHDINEVFKTFFGNEMHMFQAQTNNFFHAMHKPQQIVKNLNLTLEQAYVVGSFPMELERWNLVDNVRYDEKLTVYVTIPCGIDDSEIMTIRDNGNSINGATKGDIKIHMKISNTTEFRRQGLDLIYKKAVTLKEALCGFEFDVKHISGKILSFRNTVNPFIIKPGFRKVIPEFGMKRENTTGNLVIEFDIVFPDQLSVDQVKAISELL